MTYAEYVAAEASAPVRHEYVGGVAVAMAGGSIEHGRLIARLVALLAERLAGKPCIALSSDVRVRVRAADRASYPDVLVVRAEIQRDPDGDHAVVNPTLIIEVLSESTEAVDREEKLADFRRLPSLTEYVLVSQRERRIDLYRKSAPRRWSLDELGRGERVTLASVGVEVSVDEVYADALGAIVG